MSPQNQRNLEEFTEFCKQHVGDGLRWVGIVDDGELRTVYFRESTKGQYTNQELRDLGTAFQQFGAQFDQLYTYPTPLGQKEAVILSFQHAHIFLFAVSETRNVMLSVDRYVGSDLSTFIEKCQNELFKR